MENGAGRMPNTNELAAIRVAAKQGECNAWRPTANYVAVTF